MKLSDKLVYAKNYGDPVTQEFVDEALVLEYKIDALQAKLKKRDAQNQWQFDRAISAENQRNNALLELDRVCKAAGVENTFNPLKEERE